MSKIERKRLVQARRAIEGALEEPHSLPRDMLWALECCRELLDEELSMVRTSDKVREETKCQ